jgi:transcriptional regulator with XRE-family HTH domain
MVTKKSTRKKRKPVARILGDNLLQWRQEQGYMLKHIADALDVSVSIISQWEHGTRFPSGMNLDRISAHMGITVSELLTDKDA